MKQREQRFIPARELRVATDAQGKSMLSGYAAVYNSLSEDLGGFREKIQPGAFTRSLKSNPDVMALSDHDVKKGILGRTKSGTLRLNDDPVGLHFECDLPDTTLGRDIATSVGRGDIDGCSFGFVAQDAQWDKTSDGVIRTLHDLDLYDVTVTAQPAYTATSVQLRSLMEADGAPEFRDAKTKNVDGEDLTASAFLIVGNPDDTSTWKLPVHFSTDEKTTSHLRNALSRFGQLRGVSAEDKAAAWTKLVKLCKEHDIEVSGERSMDSAACQCDCPECEDGDCANCSNADCEDENCDGLHQDNRTDKLLAYVLERRLRG